MSLAPDAVLEAIDGPVVVGTLEGKSMPILTRFPDGRIGFRMMGKFLKAEAPVALVKVTFENGRSVRVGAGQIFLLASGEERKAADLEPGDGIAQAWDYPEGYRPPDLSERREADGTVRVASVGSEGEGEVLGAPIRETGVFFLSLGALLKA